METAIGIVAGGVLTIVITILIEVLRRPKLRMQLAAPVDVDYPAGAHAKTGRYLHIEVENKPLAWGFRWLARDAALQCRGTIMFHHLDGGRYFATPMFIRFARTPEPLPLEFRGSGIAGVIVDPVRLSLESRFDLYPGEATPFDVAVKFDSEDACYGWSNANYFSNPRWRDPDRKLPPGRYLVAVALRSNSAQCTGLFRLLNEGGPKSFRLERAAPKDKVR